MFFFFVSNYFSICCECGIVIILSSFYHSMCCTPDLLFFSIMEKNKGEETWYFLKYNKVFIILTEFCHKPISCRWNKLLYKIILNKTARDK